MKSMDELSQAIDDILGEDIRVGSDPALADRIAQYLCMGEGWLLRQGRAYPVHELHDSYADDGYRRWDLITTERDEED